MFGRNSKSQWENGYIEWTENKNVYISVVFSWLLKKAIINARQWQFAGYKVHIGGPAVPFNLEFLNKYSNLFIQIGGEKSALKKHNPNATFTTRGCIRKCKFCAVPKIEGKLRELPDHMWEPKPIICDNNLLAASTKHFDNVIDRLLKNEVKNIDFNQGLDARLMTNHHAKRIFELHQIKSLKKVRLAWDDIKTESRVKRAVDILRRANIPKDKIGMYILIGYNDSPKDALYRLNTTWKILGILPNPMRYQPLNSLDKNKYVGKNWTDLELKRYTVYWSNLNHLSKIPFQEFDRKIMYIKNSNIQNFL